MLFGEKEMKRTILLTVVMCVMVSVVSADIFGSGANEFTIDFVNISGDSGNLGNWSAGSGYTFSGVNHGDYRMGKLEITNSQFAKFATNNPIWSGYYIPANRVSWYEAAQFVNYLNMDAGYDPAYKFSGTGDYVVWDAGDDGYDALNPFRNSNAHYFLPTEDEWVKAAYWNGTSLQTWATPDNTEPVEDVEANYDWDGSNSDPWFVGSGSKELNGTYDMMGNLWEWMESPYSTGNYTAGSYRSNRGGCYGDNIGYYYGNNTRSSKRISNDPVSQFANIGFRVASVPEPGTMLLLGLGGVLLRRK
jgi:formylglycine-generating enzyme required for sulfatase activity